MFNYFYISHIIYIGSFLKSPTTHRSQQPLDGRVNGAQQVDSPSCTVLRVTVALHLVSMPSPSHSQLKRSPKEFRIIGAILASLLDDMLL